MEKTQCMGCQTSFQDGQIVILQNLTTQYKNYHLPLKDDKAKWTILKTVVSFLNSQGGTIYIGIQDEKGTVQGVFLTRKQRDNFKLSMKHLLQKINPKVDLNNKQQINIQFVPVVKNEQFQGKYVVKIIVQQGDPSSVYTFAQKIKLEGSNNKTDEYQIFYAYERHNMGGTNEIKGVKLLNLIQQKAKKPLIQSTTFHQGCNPQPPHLQLNIHSIYFTNTNASHMKIMQQTFEQNFEKEDIDYQTIYLKDEKIIKLTINDLDDFKNVKTFIVQNIQYLNEQIFKNQTVEFEVKGQCHHYFHIENVYEKNQKNVNKMKNQPIPKKQKKQKIVEKPLRNQYIKPFNKPNINEVKNIEPIQKPKIQQIKSNNNPNFPKKYCLTFTHIQPNTQNQLQSFLNNSIIKAYDKNIVKYINTIEVFLRSEQQFAHYFSVVLQKQKQLQAFGFKQQIRFGINKGILQIRNFDNKKKQQLQQFLFRTCDQLSSCESIKEKGQIFQLKFRQKSSACSNLDLLLNNRELKRQYSIPNSRNGNLPKIKIYLQVGLE